MDDTLLLWLSSERLLQYESDVGGRGNSGARMRAALGEGLPPDAWELERLISAYDSLYADYSNRLLEQGYKPGDPIFDTINAEHRRKTQDLQRRLEALQRARQRRYRPTIVRRLARFVGKIVGGGVTAAGQVVHFTMEHAVPTVIRAAPKIAQELVRDRLRQEKERFFNRVFRLVARRIGADAAEVIREVALPLFRRAQEKRRRRRQARIQTQTAQALVREQAPPAAGETAPAFPSRIELTEEDLDASDSYVAWFNYDSTSPRTWMTEVGTLDLWLEFDFEHGVLRGEFEATGVCGSAQCDYPEEWAASEVRGRIVDGWLRPNDKNGWDWGGTVENTMTIAGLNVLGEVHRADGSIILQTDEGAKSGTVAARIEGSTSPGCGAAPTVGRQPPCFLMGGPWDSPGSQYLAFWFACSAPTCGLPEVWPVP